MRVLYSNDGFEQDSTPQICVEGSNIDYFSLINNIENAIKNNKEGDFLVLPAETVDEKVKLVFSKYSGRNKIIVGITDNLYQISLDARYWQEVIDILKPLTLSKGYQFIEFNNLNNLDEIGLIFKSI
jgi:hypothetical protein